ncbi:MAG: NusA-like transcription termination signal-binding factor [Candidatus Aenigmarchaeota archaeon]|nr:NusA-like transcription termination signal-binding factor [Candidatus Aenigmarchaeota archaeon]
MKVTLDTNTIQCINLFNNLTRCSVIDCIDEDDELYFVVGEGQYGLAVGKGGSTIRNAERVFKKNIKVFEYSDDLERFIRNLVPEAQEVNIDDKEVVVKIKPQDRARVIGRSGKNIRIIKMLLERFFEVQHFRVK